MTLIDGTGAAEFSLSKVSIVGLQQARRSQAYHARTFIQLEATRRKGDDAASARDLWMKSNLRTSTVSEDLGSMKSTLVQQLVPVIELSGWSLR